MPSGIILASSSQGATQEAIEKVLTEHGFEPDKPAQQEPTEPVEPKRDDFKTDEEFEQAQEDYETKLEETEQQREEQEEQERQKREQQQGTKPSRRQRAVEKATKELREELRKANERLAALETGKKPAAEQPKVEELKEPKREQFKTDKEYDDALFDYRYKLRRQKEAVEDAQKALNDRLQKNFTDYKSSVAAFKEEHDDWDKVVNQDLALPESVYFAIVDLAEEGPAVTYHLGKNPAELERLANMTPYRAAIEVGRLADKLKGESKPAARSTPGNTKPKPKLPEPVQPVSTAATSSTLTSRDAAQKRDFKAFKQAQRAGR